MPWSGGTFTRTNGVFNGQVVWLQDKTAGTKITTEHHDTHDQDLATGINNCVAKDGTNTPTADMNWGGYRLRNMGAGVLSNDAAVIGQLQQYVQVQVVPEDTVLTTGTTKLTFRIPYSVTITAVRASLATEQTGGSIVTIDINRFAGSLSSILSTKLTIDNGSRTSVGAATPPVISNPTHPSDREFTIDIDQVGDGTAKGLRVTLIGLFGTV